MSVFLNSEDGSVRIVYAGSTEKAIGYRPGEVWQVFRRCAAAENPGFYHSVTLTVPAHTSAQDALRLAEELDTGPSTEET